MKTFILLSAVLALAAAGTVQPSLYTKVSSAGRLNVILELPQVIGIAESSPVLSGLSRQAKAVALVNMLTDLTSTSQAPYITLAQQLGIKYEQFWASNIVLLENITVDQLSAFASTAVGSFELREEYTAMVDPIVHSVNTNVSERQGNQWGVDMIRAPDAWTTTQGEGIVVAIMDTGVNLGHEALSTNYAGAWRDPYYNTPGPTDQHGHGSHCAGSILGTTNGIGVAPAAKWIACRGLNHLGSGSEAALTTCAQFMLTSNPIPNVVSNSWGGAGGSSWYNAQISAWRAAGIIPVFAIGNSGCTCRTAGSPGDQPNLISVGSTTDEDVISCYSSRGDPDLAVKKPEVSAPGQMIVSAGTLADNYVTMSGTSMACPHTAGAIALILAANPTYTFDQVLSLLQSTTTQQPLRPFDRRCGISGTEDYPNNVYGHGRIDVGAAIAAASVLRA